MEKKKKSKRGGKRPGAGRKVSNTQLPAETVQSTEGVTLGGDQPFEPLPEVTKENKEIEKVSEPKPKRKPVTFRLPVKKSSPERGIVILALGSAEYGKMAANAAASIRYVDKKTPIHLVYSDRALSHLSPQHKELFTTIAECPQDFITKDGKVNYFKAKTCIYELSPFDETLLIDADLLCFAAKPIAQLMNELSATDFAIQSRGVHDCTTGKTDGRYTHWFDTKEARIAYNLDDKIYQLSSEVIWFRKTKQTKRFFAKVREVFDNPLIKQSVEFAGDLPDEFAFNIASAIMKVYPRKADEVFIYWEFMDKKNSMLWPEVLKTYYGYSAGGNSIKPSALTRYSQMARAHASVLRLPYHFNIYPKRKWDSSRKAL